MPGVEDSTRGIHSAVCVHACVLVCAGAVSWVRCVCTRLCSCVCRAGVLGALCV